MNKEQNSDNPQAQQLNIAGVMTSDLSESDIRIIKIQNALMLLGYQWKEHIFNGGFYDNCYVVFSKNTDCNYFSDNILGDMGWGRFTRLEAWNKAFEELTSYLS
jgi:hypothetical protein